MSKGALWRTVGPPAVVVLLLAGAIFTVVLRMDPDRSLAAAAKTLDFRPIEGRLARPLVHRPYRPFSTSQHMRHVASVLRGRWYGRRSSESGRVAGAALLLAGHTDQAFAIFVDLLREGSQEADLRRVIQTSIDAPLLTDFSAAALEQPPYGRNLLLAYEAADRAWQMARSPDAGWNRAVAADRIGIHTFAERAWREVRAREPSAEWARECEARRADTARRAAEPPPPSLELLFYRELFVAAVAGEPLHTTIDGDRLAADTAAALRDVADRERLHAAITTYIRGRDAFEQNEFITAGEAYAAAEAEFAALRVPLVFVARDQRIRSECSQAKPGCLDAMRRFRRELTATGRYPWLAARSIYGEGQTLYRQGHVYEAAVHLERALSEFERLGDATSAAFMHVLLTNVYAAGGESDLALRHFLQGVAFRTPAIVDRRRKILEDGIAFMLRHNYLATAELLLTELTAAVTTDASNVTEATLRGIAAFRRGDRHRASQYFNRARVLLRAVKDEASRTDVQFRLAIAEAGARMQSATPTIADLDASIIAHSGGEFSIWLPQLLTERGAAYERDHDLARAEADYRRAIAILESREPRIDQTVLALGISTPGESPFDRAIRLLLSQRRVIAALLIAQRANGLRISSLHAHSAGVRDVYRQPHEGDDGVMDTQQTLRADEFAVAQHLLSNELITWLITRDAVRATRQPVQPQHLIRAAERLQNCRMRTCDAAAAMLSAPLLHRWIDQVPRGATIL